MKSRIVSATEFKAKCLAILDEVNEHGATVTVTKRGLPVAVVGPARKPRRKSFLGAWVGKVQLAENWESIDFTDQFEALKE